MCRLSSLRVQLRNRRVQRTPKRFNLAVVGVPHTAKHKNMYQKGATRKQLKKEPAERRKIDVLANKIRRIGGQDSRSQTETARCENQ